MENRQNPVVFYLLMFVYMLLALLLRAVMLAPLAFLTTEKLKLCALLCPVLLVFIVLPLRFSFADALVQPSPRSRSFSLKEAFSFSQYGEKLAESLKHAVRVLLWGIPMFAWLGYNYYLFRYGENLSYISSFIPNLGKTGTAAVYPIVNFFRGLFGKEALPAPGVDLASGIVVLGVIVGVCALIWLYGAVRNSATRYIWVVANRGESTLGKECRRRLHGRRWRQLGVALLNLLLCVPFFAVAVLTVKDTLVNLCNNALMYVMTGSLPLKELAACVLPLTLAFFGLYMTLLPARRWLTASFATAQLRHKVPGND